MNTILIKLASVPAAGRGFASGWLKLALVTGFGLLASLAVAQPANDNFTNAVTIGGLSGTVSGTNSGATLEVDEPPFINADDYAGVVKSVWYKWTAPSNGVVAFDTFGSGFDTVLAVYTNSPAVTNLVAANDDYISMFVVQSWLTFTAVGGTTYYISVNGNQSPVPGYSDEGSFVFNWKETVPTIRSGDFYFTAANYIVSDSDSSSPMNVPMATVPAWIDARVTVTRTNGSSGRVRVPYTVAGIINQPLTTNTGTLIFDDYQMSADIRVPVAPIPAITNFTLIANFTGYIYLNDTNGFLNSTNIGQTITNAGTLVTSVTFTNYSTNLYYLNSYATTNIFTYITNFTGYFFVNTNNPPNPPPAIGQTTINGTTYTTPVVFTNYSAGLNYTTNYATTNIFTYITNFTGYIYL